jgi:hypothetical protein
MRRDIRGGDLVVGHRRWGETLTWGRGGSGVAGAGQIRNGCRHRDMAALWTAGLTAEVPRVEFEGRAAGGASASDVHETLSPQGT